MVLATICYLALPSLGFHAFVPLAPPRPVARWPAVPLATAPAVQAALRPAAPGAFLPPLRPRAAVPQALRVPQDVTLRLPVSQAAPLFFSPASYVYGCMMLGACALAVLLVRRALAGRSTARWRLLASSVREKAKSLIYTFVALAATSIMLFASPAGALSTSEAPAPAAVQRLAPVKKFPSPLTGLIKRPEASQQKKIKYSHKGYIFSDDLTRLSRLDREFDDIVWHSLINRRQNQVKTLVNLGEGVALVAGVGTAGLAWERYNKEQERKDIEEELELTGRYVSPDASNVKVFMDAKTGKVRENTAARRQAVPESIVVNYEIRSRSAKLEQTLRNKVEGPEFSRAMVDQLQYLFQEFAESKRDDMKEDFETLVTPNIPAAQAPMKQLGGVIEGRVFITELGSDVTNAVLKYYGNTATRPTVIEGFQKAVADALGVEEEVTITNIVRNQDPLFGEGGKLADGKVRQLLSRRASWLLKWIESMSTAEDESFWDTAVTQSIYKDPGQKKAKTDGSTGGDD